MGDSWGWVTRVAAERYRAAGRPGLGETVEDLCRQIHLVRRPAASGPEPIKAGHPLDTSLTSMKLDAYRT
jgi:hypothetical protein